MREAGGGQFAEMAGSRKQTSTEGGAAGGEPGAPSPTRRRERQPLGEGTPRPPERVRQALVPQSKPLTHGVARGT